MIQKLQVLTEEHKHLLQQLTCSGVDPWQKKNKFSAWQEYKKMTTCYSVPEIFAGQLLTTTDIAMWRALLKVPSIEVMEALVNTPVYHEFSIAKKNGKVRNICAPDKALKKVQQRINLLLQMYYVLCKPNSVYGFCLSPEETNKVSPLVTHASVHVGKRYLLNLDIKDFFSSIKAPQVYATLSGILPMAQEDSVKTLALLTTHQKTLPTGAPTSPVLSNLVCIPMDKALENLAAAKGFYYSRYADDLSFSSDEYITEKDVADILMTLGRFGFDINRKKLRLSSYRTRQVVTGLTVNEKVNVSRPMLKKVRAMVHRLKTSGLEEAARRHFKTEPTERTMALFMHQLNGYLGFIEQVRGK